MQFIKIAILSVCLSSCGPKNTEKADLPNYSDMGAAADAGRISP